MMSEVIREFELNGAKYKIRARADLDNWYVQAFENDNPIAKESKVDRNDRMDMINAQGVDPVQLIANDIETRIRSVSRNSEKS
jgi:hypothetical protein